MAFDAFISYSHSADGQFAPALQKGLQQLARPWTRRRALRIFRDDTGLSVNPALWQSITDALDESDYLVLLASPGAAQSEWVGKEIEYWMASRPDAARSILPVLTEGTFVWDSAANDIDWNASDAAHPALAGVFTEEPRHLDFVWAKSDTDLNLRNSRFRDAVADIAAPIHGIPKDELEGEDIRQHRRAVFARRAAIAALVLLFFGVSVAGFLANRALRDLEDANGNISELEERRTELENLNAEAAASLAEAERLAAEADRARIAAEAAQAAADAARAAADTARAAAETARAEAEAAKANAEADAATARQAEAAALIKEAEALEAQRVAEQAEQKALDAAAAANKAAGDAITAQGNAEDAQKAAEAAELAANLASASAGAESASTALLLASESYCATADCGSGTDPLALTDSHSSTSIDLGSLRLMLDTVRAQADFLDEKSSALDQIVDVAISADGTTTAALGRSGEIEIWREDRPGESVVLAPPVDGYLPEIIGMTLSADGGTIVYYVAAAAFDFSGVPSGVDERVVWADARTGEQITSITTTFHPLDGSPHDAAHITLHPDADVDRVLVWFDDGDSWLVMDGLPLTSENFPANFIALAGPAGWSHGEAIAFTPGAATHYDSDGTLVEELQGLPPQTPTAVASHGDWIAIGYGDGSVATYNRYERPRPFPTAQDAGSITEVALGPGELVVSVAADGSVWRRGTRISPAVRTPVSIAAAADADVHVVANERSLVLRRANVSHPLTTPVRTEIDGDTVTFVGAHGTITRTVAHPFQQAFLAADESVIVAAGRREVSVLWPDGSSDPRNLDLLDGVEPDNDFEVRFVALKGDGSLVAVEFINENQSHLRIFDARTGSIEARHVTDESLYVDGDGISVADVVFVDGGYAFRTRTFYTNALTSEGALVAYELDDDMTPTHDIRLPAPRPIGALEGPDGGVLLAEPTGRILLYGIEGTAAVELLDVGIDDTVTALAASPEFPDLIVLGFASGLVEIWDYESGRQLLSLTDTRSEVDDLRLERVGAAMRITVGSYTTEAWTITPDGVRAAVCDLAGRDLTAAEWSAFAIGDDGPLPCRRGLH